LKNGKNIKIAMNTIIRSIYLLLFVLLIFQGVVIVVDPTFFSYRTSQLLLASIVICFGIVYYFYRRRNLQNSLDVKIILTLFLSSVAVYCLWVSAISLGWIDYNPTWLTQP
jgi:uncharacterized membrane protein HdeD (DUF308 family)